MLVELNNARIKKQLDKGLNRMLEKIDKELSQIAEAKIVISSRIDKIEKDMQNDFTILALKADILKAEREYIVAYDKIIKTYRDKDICIK
ncbi:MAG: hypothetical protein ACRDD7_01475 [Peptostreptococcaceae bacterium]